jgi:hypothetical protein
MLWLSVLTSLFIRWVTPFDRMMLQHREMGERTVAFSHFAAPVGDSQANVF